MPDIIQNGTIAHQRTDDKLIAMWLHNRPSRTTEIYQKAVDKFSEFVQKPLQVVILEDLQAYASHLSNKGLKESTIKLELNAVKSLFTFATKLNYVRFNVAAALRIPKAESSLSNRILKQSQVLKLISGAAAGRDRALLKLVYATGMRVSEVCRLRWCDFAEREDGEVQVTILGKGNKIRVVIVPASVWVDLEMLKGESDAVFVSVRGEALDRTMVHKIIKAAAQNSGINPKVSAHWVRHCHASHALQKGASIALVRDSLGHSSVAITDKYLHSVPSDSSGNYLGL